MTNDLLCFVSEHADKLHDVRIENIELKKENKRLRDALAPFANWSSAITHGDIERAKELLNEEG